MALVRWLCSFRWPTCARSDANKPNCASAQESTVGVCSGFQDWTLWLLRCNALQVLHWDEDTREAPEQFCRFFISAWRPLTVQVWEIALQLRPRAVSYTMVYWLCMLCQDCSPFRPGTVFMSTQWRTWSVADHDWSPTLPYGTVLATATELLPARGAAQ